MNLAEALVAVPEIPVAQIARRKLKLNPDLIVREELDENGNPAAVVFVPEHRCVYRMPSGQYEMLKLFDGERSFAEIAEIFREMGGSLSEEEIKEFALSAEDSGLWYVSAQEKNITLSQKLAAERHKRVQRKSSHGDLTHMVFRFWDPDTFLAKLNARTGFIYTLWFTAITLGLFAFTGWIWIDKWAEIGHDTVLYYSFSNKNASSLLEFWILFLVMGFLHETAHGLTCKHYGGNVHNIGFQLIYLAPAFAADITEVWVRTGKWQRIAAIMAGIWIETIVCSLATLVWWTTPLGSGVHELAYKFMLITGVMVVVMNLNPLIKLDGYYALSEVIGIQDLKEKSTAFLSGWAKQAIFRLPVEVDFVPTKRRILFAVYALLSGAYSYLLLFAVARFSYNVFRAYSPDWAFIPAGYLTWRIFRSRILKLVAFMKTVYIGNRSSLAFHRNRVFLVGGSAVVALLFVPMFHVTSSALFVLEPVQRAVVRALVPGRVEQVLVGEGTRVSEGMPLIRLGNPELQSQLASANAAVELARSHFTAAQVKLVSIGSAQVELNRAEQVANATSSKIGQLLIRAPMDGVVTTSRVHDLAGSYAKEGATLLEIDDTSVLYARLFLPEYEVRDLQIGASVAMHLSSGDFVRGTVLTISAAPSEPPSGLMAPSEYKGLNTLNYYVVTASVNNPGNLKPGVDGEAKIIGRRRSVARIIVEEGSRVVLRRLW